MIKIFTALLLGLGVAGGTVAMASTSKQDNRNTILHPQHSFSKGRTIANTSRRQSPPMVGTCTSGWLDRGRYAHTRLCDT